MTPPERDKAVTLDGIEATPENIRPARKLGEETDISLHIDSDASLDTSAPVRYRLLRQFEVYAGEANVSKALGGRAYVRETPLDIWPVDSHIVPVIYGDGIVDDESFWGVIDAVEDNSTILGPPETGDGEAYGMTVYGFDQYGELAVGPGPNHYRLSISITTLAPLREYDSRSELLADLSPVVNQL